ncbi:MAG: NUDIX domain-containing protein [Actinomycetota bacterium]|nr:NUDIX domain-containing protein [Actinomycetota bacterium]
MARRSEGSSSSASTPASRSTRRKPPRSALPDILAPGLRIVFCGINPGRWSAAAGAHFANPRNDFWRLLHHAELTPRRLEPAEQRELLSYGLGVTNAAARTTAGSGDLRLADFAGAAERLERLAEELRPLWIGFVGKEAYRGVFRERPALGLQQRRLAATQLFVLPSTSPANAAVPYEERLRWFQELAGRSTGFPLRDAVRALVRDPQDRVLLVRFDFPDKTVWACPGGGLEREESEEAAIARELREEAGFRDFELGPCIWTRTHWFRMKRWAGQRERIYLVRVPAREPEPELSWDALREEWMTDVRWWTRDELEAHDGTLSPRRLRELLRDLDERGPPPDPIDVGV